jgi:protein SCO1/2
MRLSVSSRHLIGALVLGVLAFPTPALAQEGANPEEGGAQAALTIDEALAKKGKSTYQNKGCTACHALGKKAAGPDLIGVTERRELDWLTSFLKDTAAMLESDPIAIEMLKEYKGAKMPNMRLSDQEVEALIHYLAQETAKKRGG